MVKLNKIVEFLNSFAPPYFAEDYDNVGLLVGDKDKDINKVLITLDADEKVVKDAKLRGCDLVISHHPLIFKPLKKVVSDDSVSRTVIELIKSDISLVSVHTNFDGVKSGLCDLFLDKIANTENRCAIEGDDENGSGRIGDLKAETTLGEILKKVKADFLLDSVRYVGNVDTKISKIAVCNGGGADFLYAAHEAGCDLFVSGDFKYHHARFAYENNMALIDVPHYNAEIMFCDYLAELLKKEFAKDIDICVTDKNTDVWNKF